MKDGYTAQLHIHGRGEVWGGSLFVFGFRCMHDEIQVQMLKQNLQRKEPAGLKL
jgi:hypothetical protein